MKIALACLAVAMLNFSGCTTKRTVPQPASQGSADKEHSLPFILVASSDGTFLLNQSAGKIWKYDQKQNAFLEVPVTSKILSYNPKTGKLESEPELNTCGRPCDKKSDPLCIM